MTRNVNTNNSTLIRSICAIVFILFTFIYLFFFQADLLFAEQHFLSGGMTHYDRTVGAVLITFVLYLLQVGVYRLTRFGNCFYALTYFPSFLFLMLLTSFKLEGIYFRLSLSLIVFVVVLLFLYVCFYFFYEYRRRIIENIPVSRLISVGYLWKNLLIMTLMSVMVCIGGNTNEVFHYRLRVESLLCSDSHIKALQIGEQSDDTDESLTMLRIYALSKTRQLGEHLFEYPLIGGSDALLPDGKNVRCMFFQEAEILKQLGIRKKGRMKPMEYLLYLKNHGLALKPVTDYILCGYLLDKNLDGFVNEIKQRYSLDSASLPKHYKEALTLYTHLRSNPVIVFHNEVMDVDYADFQKLERKYADKRERTSYMKDSYGGTYWFYYFYHE